MKKFREYYKWIVAFVFCVAVIAVYKTFDNIGNIGKGINVILEAAAPFFGGFVIAYLLNLPSKKLDNLLKKIKFKYIRNHSYGISVALMYLFSALVLFIVIRSLVPALYKNFMDFSTNLPYYFQSTLDWINNLEIVQKFHIIDPEKINASDTVYSLLRKIDPTSFNKSLQGLFNVTTGVFSVFISIIASVYMLLDKDRILGGLVRLISIFFSKEKAKSICTHAKRINYIFTSYIYCRVLCSAIMAVVCSVALSIMKVKYAVILGLFIGAMDMIPYFGSIISVVISGIVIFITGGVFKTVWTMIVLLVLQQLDGNLLAPKIMGMSLDMRPLWIIVVVTLGGSLFGVLGMLLSVPVAAVIRAIAVDYIDEYAQKKKMKQQIEEDV